MNKGILIVSGGSWFYGSLLMNLVASIRAISDVNICAYSTIGCLSENQLRQLKAKNVQVRFLPAHITGHPANYLRPKVHLYDLSPFDKTLFLDADTLWLKKQTPEVFMEKLEGIPFTTANEGHFDLVSGADKTNAFYTLWSDHQELLKAYQHRMKDRIYKLRSEVIYFERSKETKKLFREAKAIYDKPLVNVMKSGAQVPDEFAFNLASSITGIYPHEEKWCPAYWDFRMKAVYRKQSLDTPSIIAAYPILSVGGNRTAKNILKWYNDMSANNFRKIAWSGHKVLPDKADILPSRKVM